MSQPTDPNRTLSREVQIGDVAPRGAAILRAVYPQGLEWFQLLSGGKTIVGRLPGEGITSLPHHTVSREHFQIEWDGRREAHFARDLGSRNGSRLNGAPMFEELRPLRDGTILQLGDTLLVYERAFRLDAPVPHATCLRNIPGQSPAIDSVRSAVQEAATDPSPILVIGETGTGKEWVVKSCHELSGRTGALVAINCSTLSPQIIESQLFGHVKGSFTGALTDHPGLFRSADGGTLFLDEIGELPLELQPKLLRVLQEGVVQPVGTAADVAVDVRVIAATNRDLTDRVERGLFRRDLYARLAMWEIRVPPLRQRRGDIVAWVDRLYARWLAERELSAPQTVQAGLSCALSADVAQAITMHEWRDNIRGLNRLVHELSSVVAAGRTVHPADLPHWLPMAKQGNAYIASDTGDDLPAQNAAPTKTVKAKNPTPIPTRTQFVQVFDTLEGNVRAIAKHFNRDRRQIYRWIEAHGVTPRKSDQTDN